MAMLPGLFRAEWALMHFGGVEWEQALEAELLSSLSAVGPRALGLSWAADVVVEPAGASLEPKTFTLRLWCAFARDWPVIALATPSDRSRRDSRDNAHSSSPLPARSEGPNAPEAVDASLALTIEGDAVLSAV